MSAPMWKTAVDEFMKGENDSGSNIVARELSNGDLKLLELVENLGDYLISVDNTARSRGTKLLADVLHQLVDDQLSEKEVELLVVYFCDRLKDHHSVQPPALLGLLALSRMKNLPDGCSQKICRGIFQEVQNQSLSQIDRRSVYTIISTLLSTKLKELLEIGTNFVYGFIQAMDAEKDPRNLVIAFNCAKIIIQNFPLGVFVEEMFEVVSCYFPIDFTPPPADVNAISRDDLILGLRGCLAASPKFGPHCYPLLLEKMTSDIPSAKLDSLKTLDVCTEVYGANCLLEFQTSFFNCIKREVFSSGSPVIEEASLSALTSIVCTLSVQNDQGSPVKGFLAEIMQICQQHLTEKDLRFMVATCRLLQSAAAGSDMSCQFILDKMLLLLTDLYNSQTVKQNNQRKSVLDMLINFLKIALKFDSTSVLTSSSGIDQSVTIVMSAITDSSRQLRQSAIQGLSVLLSFKDVLTPEMKLTAVTTLLNVAFTDNDISEECSAVFTVLANTDIEILKSSVLPVFIKALRRSMTEPMEVDGVNYNHSALFKYLTCVTLSTNVLKIVITELLIAISDITKGLRKGNSADFIQIVTCVSTIFKSSVTDPSSLEYLYEDVVPGIYSILVYMVTNGDSLDNFEHSHNILESLSACIRYTTTTIGHGQLKEFCDKIASLYLCEDCRSFIPFPDQLPVKFQPLQVTSPWQQTQMVSLLTPVICSCPSQVAVSRVNKYIEKLSDLSTLSTHTYTQLSACKCLGGLVNKCPLDENLSRFLQSCQDKLNSVMKSDDTNKYNHVIQWIWLTKALVLRGHPKAKIYISQLLDLLESEEVGEQAAHGFNIILTEQDDVMNKTMNANIRIMYKQRLFQENVTRLSSGFQSSNSGTKKNYLIVLSYMLKVLPKQVMLSELPPLFPLLVHSLLCEDTNLQISTMATLYDLTQEAPDIISKHTDSVIPQLLKLCKNPKSMKIRINALRCIGVLTLLPGHLIIPYKNEVIRELEGILDDKKRLVRKEAVTARGEWFLLEHVNQ